MMPEAARATPRLHKADLHMLAVFMTVVECGGFAAAQVTLNVGQSTISRQIGDLETRLYSATIWMAGARQSGWQY